MKAILEKGKLTAKEDSFKPKYSFNSPKDFFSISTNAVPLVSSIHPARLLLADKAILQALPLVNGEAPLVHHKGSDKDTEVIYSEYGKNYLSVLAKESGKVSYIDGDEIRIKTDKGKEIIQYLAQHFPMGRKSFLHHTPTVKVGDTVRKDQVIATSNYADKDGNAKIGVNLKTAIMPARGFSFEDAYVVTESGAKKLASEQLIPVKLSKELGGVEVGKNKFVSLFPNRYLNNQLSKIDSNGLIKRGQRVKFGDPVILAVAPKSLKTSDIQLGKLSKTLKNAFKDISETWEYESDGEVIDVVDTPSIVTVTIKTVRNLQVGDKLSTLGFKGVVSTILPDTQAPRYNDGTPIDLLLNPMAITSRVAPAVVPLMALGKVAEKRKKPVIVTQFYKNSSVEDTEKTLKKYGLSDTDELYDPVSNRKMRVFTGPLYMHKLVHISEDKLSESGDDAGVSFDQQPTKTPESSPKKVGNLMTTALLSHGATANLQDVSIRATKNNEFWRRLKLGQPLPSVGRPFVFDKFVSSLRGSGVSVREDGLGNYSFLPLTNKDVESISKGKIEQPTTFRVTKDNRLEAEAGGLFDPAKTGLLGDQYNHIELNMKIPNPISEDYLKKLLKMTDDQFRDAIVTGDLERELNKIDVDKQIEELKKYIKTGKKSERDRAIKVYKFLTNLKNNGIHPKDLLLDKVPVIPAMFRPVAVQGDLVMSSDVNSLYRDALLLNDSLKRVTSTEKKAFEKIAQKQATITEDLTKKAKLGVYDAVKAIYGFGEPVTKKSQEKDVKGLLGTMLGVRGGRAKGAKFQANIVGKTVGMVGRGTVIPDPTLDLDEIGLPQDTILKIYTPTVTRRLVQKGIPSVDAMRMLKTKHPLAMHELNEEIKDRPVMLTRDPQLHKFSIVGAYVKPNVNPKDTNIHVPVLITKGLGMDFDGDSANVHVPVTDSAKEEVKQKLLPSKNLLSVKTFEPMHLPSNESALGLNMLSTASSNRKALKYKSLQEVERDFLAGKINIDDNVEIS